MLSEVGAKSRNVRGAAWAPGAKDIVITGPDSVKCLLIFDQNIKFWVCLSVCSSAM